MLHFRLLLNMFIMIMDSFKNTKKESAMILNNKKYEQYNI